MRLSDQWRSIRHSQDGWYPPHSDMPALRLPGFDSGWPATLLSLGQSGVFPARKSAFPAVVCKPPLSPGINYRWIFRPCVPVPRFHRTVLVGEKYPPGFLSSPYHRTDRSVGCPAHQYPSHRARQNVLTAPGSGLHSRIRLYSVAPPRLRGEWLDVRISDRFQER